MSADALPITRERFAAAIEDLPPGTLFAKASELQNSIHHLTHSNEQLREYEDDPDCREALAENEGVLERMRERIQLLKGEVEKRGLRWVDPADGGTNKEGTVGGEEVVPNGQVEGVGEEGDAVAAGEGQRVEGAEPSSERAQRPSGRLTDEQLRRLLEARMGDGGDDGDDGDQGVHL